MRGFPLGRFKTSSIRVSKLYTFVVFRQSYKTRRELLSQRLVEIKTVFYLKTYWKKYDSLGQPWPRRQPKPFSIFWTISLRNSIHSFKIDRSQFFYHLSKSTSYQHNIMFRNNSTTINAHVYREILVRFLVLLLRMYQRKLEFSAKLTLF